MFNPLHNSMNQKLLENHLCNLSSHYETCGWCRVFQLHCLSSESVVSIPLPCQLHCYMNQDRFEKDLSNQSSHYEKYRQFPFQRKPSCATTKSALFTVSKGDKRIMEHKGGHWLVHEECIVCTVVCQKAHLRLNSEKLNS